MGENGLGKAQLGDVIREVRNTPIDEAMERIVDAYFDEEGVPIPREGYEYGDNPYQQYRIDQYETPDNVKFFAIEGSFLPGDVFAGSWLRATTESGGVYSLHVMELDEVDGQMVVVGKVNKSGGRGQRYIAGKSAIPAVGEPLTFSEYANFESVGDVDQIRYVDPEQIRARIRTRIAELEQQHGDAWKSMSITGMRNEPYGTELHPLEATKVALIELGSD